MIALTRAQKRATTYRVRTGDRINTVIAGMVLRSRETGLRVICTFNGVQIIVSPETTEEEAYNQWETTRNRLRSPFKTALYERHHEAYQEEVEVAKQKVYQLLASEKMAVPWYKLIGYWRACWAQRDSFSKELLRFAQAWAVAMQREIRSGKKAADVMDGLERELDYVGLSGFAYGICKNFLKTFWKYSDQLP